MLLEGRRPSMISIPAPPTIGKSRENGPDPRPPTVGGTKMTEGSGRLSSNGGSSRILLIISVVLGIGLYLRSPPGCSLDPERNG